MDKIEMPYPGRKRKAHVPDRYGATSVKVRVPFEVYQRLEEEADKNNRSISFVVRECIETALPKE